MNYKQKIDQLKQNGYALDLGNVISQSIENYKKIAITAGGAIMLASIVIGALVFGSLAITIGFGDFASKMADFHVSNFSIITLLLYVAGTSLFGALMYPFTAGLIKMAHEAETGREVNLSMIFDHYKSEFFKELFTAGLLISLGTEIVVVLFQYLHMDFIGTIITYAIAFITVFTIPLIIFGQNKAMEAILNSIALLFKQPFVILIALIVSGLIAFVGIIALCIGIFFTVPIVYSTYYILYKNIVGVENKTEIDYIGSISDL